MGKYLLAHDLGTSGNKATLFSIEGQLIASCTYCLLPNASVKPLNLFMGI